MAADVSFIDSFNNLLTFLLKALPLGGSICLTSDVIEPFHRLSLPTNPQLLEPLVRAFDDIGKIDAFRFSPKTLYTIFAIALQFPYSKEQETLLFSFLPVISTYKHEQRKTTKVAQIGVEMVDRSSIQDHTRFICQNLMRHALSIMLQSSSGKRKISMATQIATRLLMTDPCALYTSANTKICQWIRSTICTGIDFVLRILVADFLREVIHSGTICIESVFVQCPDTFRKPLFEFTTATNAWMGEIFGLLHQIDSQSRVLERRHSIFRVRVLEFEDGVYEEPAGNILAVFSSTAAVFALPAEPNGTLSLIEVAFVTDTIVQSEFMFGATAQENGQDVVNITFPDSQGERFFEGRTKIISFVRFILANNDQTQGVVDTIRNRLKDTSECQNEKMFTTLNAENETCKQLIGFAPMNRSSEADTTLVRSDGGPQYRVTATTPVRKQLKYQVPDSPSTVLNVMDDEQVEAWGFFHATSLPRQRTDLYDRMREMQKSPIHAELSNHTPQISDRAKVDVSSSNMEAASPTFGHSYFANQESDKAIAVDAFENKGPSPTESSMKVDSRSILHDTEVISLDTARTQQLPATVDLNDLRLSETNFSLSCGPENGSDSSAAGLHQDVLGLMRDRNADDQHLDSPCSRKLVQVGRENATAQPQPLPKSNMREDGDTFLEEAIKSKTLGTGGLDFESNPENRILRMDQHQEKVSGDRSRRPLANSTVPPELYRSQRTGFGNSEDPVGNESYINNTPPVAVAPSISSIMADNETAEQPEGTSIQFLDSIAERHQDANTNEVILICPSSEMSLNAHKEWPSKEKHAKQVSKATGENPGTAGISTAPLTASNSKILLSADDMDNRASGQEISVRNIKNPADTTASDITFAAKLNKILPVRISRNTSEGRRQDNIYGSAQRFIAYVNTASTLRPDLTAKKGYARELSFSNMNHQMVTPNHNSRLVSHQWNGGSCSASYMSVATSSPATSQHHAASSDDVVNGYSNVTQPSNFSAELAAPDQIKPAAYEHEASCSVRHDQKSELKHIVLDSVTAKRQDAKIATIDRTIAGRYRQKHLKAKYFMGKISREDMTRDDGKPIPSFDSVVSLSSANRSKSFVRKQMKSAKFSAKPRIVHFAKNGPVNQGKTTDSRLSRASVSVSPYSSETGCKTSGEIRILADSPATMGSCQDTPVLSDVGTPSLYENEDRKVSGARNNLHSAVSFEARVSGAIPTPSFHLPSSTSAISIRDSSEVRELGTRSVHELHQNSMSKSSLRTSQTKLRGGSVVETIANDDPVSDLKATYGGTDDVTLRGPLNAHTEFHKARISRQEAIVKTRASPKSRSFPLSNSKTDSWRHKSSESPGDVLTDGRNLVEFLTLPASIQNCDSVRETEAFDTHILDDSFCSATTVPKISNELNVTNTKLKLRTTSNEQLSTSQVPHTAVIDNTVAHGCEVESLKPLNIDAILQPDVQPVNRTGSSGNRKIAQANRRFKRGSNAMVDAAKQTSDSTGATLPPPKRIKADLANKQSGQYNIPSCTPLSFSAIVCKESMENKRAEQSCLTGIEVSAIQKGLLRSTTFNATQDPDTIGEVNFGASTSGQRRANFSAEAEHKDVAMSDRMRYNRQSKPVEFDHCAQLRKRLNDLTEDVLSRISHDRDCLISLIALYNRQATNMVNSMRVTWGRKFEHEREILLNSLVQERQALSDAVAVLKASEGNLRGLDSIPQAITLIDSRKEELLKMMQRVIAPLIQPNVACSMVHD